MLKKEWEEFTAKMREETRKKILRECCNATLRRDEDVELCYFNARWYDPTTARFMTEDPVKDGLLWYAYCNNNPLKFIDPTGLAKEDRLRRRANRAEEDGDDDRAAELRAEANAIEQARQEQQERVKELPDGYSGINGLSKQGESNQYPDTPNMDDFLTDDTLTDSEKQELLEKIGQYSTITSSGMDALIEAGLVPSSLSSLGKGAAVVGDAASIIIIHGEIQNLKLALENGDQLGVLDSSATIATNAIGIVSPLTGAITGVYAEAAVESIDFAVQVNTYASRDPIGFMEDLNAVFGSSFTTPWSHY